MRKVLISAAMLAALAACQPPAPRESGETETPPPTAIACNSVAPNAAAQVSVQEPVAAAASDLRGGRIAPGVYDLQSATRLGAATGWQGTRAIALDVTEDNSGVTFNWASATADGNVEDRWTAAFTEAPTPHLTYSCGRIGGVDAEFVAQGGALSLHIPDGANGRLALVFQRRS